MVRNRKSILKVLWKIAVSKVLKYPPKFFLEVIVLLPNLQAGLLLFNYRKDTATDFMFKIFQYKVLTIIVFQKQSLCRRSVTEVCFYISRISLKSIALFHAKFLFIQPLKTSEELLQFEINIYCIIKKKRISRTKGFLTFSGHREMKHWR